MKNGKSIVILAVLIVAGCKPPSAPKQSPPFRPLQNGFGVVAKWVGVDSGPGAALYYKGTNDTPVLVWPYIGTRGYPILYSNDIAFLLADKPDAHGHLGGGVFILAQGTGMAMDISNDVLRQYAMRTNANFSTLLQIYTPLRLEEHQGEMTVTYVPSLESRIREGLTFPITWEQIFVIMEDVKLTGRTNKITSPDFVYLQKAYEGSK